MSDKSMVDSFLETNIAKQRDPGLGIDGLEYDPFLKKWLPPNQSRVDGYKARFIEVIEEFERTHFKSRASTVDIRAFHTWDDVLAHAESARKAYEDRSRGFKGLMSLAGRKIGNQSSTIAPVLQTVLPSNDYSSVVCGAVILIFQAFNAVQDVRTLVFDTLSTAPPLLENVQRMLDLYSSDQQLHSSAEELCRALFIAVESIIAFLSKPQWKRLAAFVKQNQYEGDLKEKIEALRSSSAKVEKEANRCDKELTKDIREELTRIEVFTCTLVSMSTEVLKTTAKISSQVEDANNGIGRIEHQLQEDSRVREKQLEQQACALDNFSQHLLGLFRQWPVRAPFDLALLRNLATITPEDVISKLGDWRDHNETLIQYYATIASDSGPDTVARILSSAEFRSWFSFGRSELLVVSHDPVAKVTQPGSVVTASLCRALAQLPPCIYAVHFCCQQSPNDCSNPVANLLACLISSLLSAIPIDLSKWSEVETQARHQMLLAHRDLEYMCSLLKHLFFRLGSGTVFIVIDDVTELEAQSDPGSFREVFTYLRDLVRFCRNRPNLLLKILITSSSRQSSVSSLLSSEECRYLHVAGSLTRSQRRITDGTREIYNMAAF